MTRAPVFVAVVGGSCVAGLAAASIVIGSTPQQQPPSDNADNARPGSDRVVARTRSPGGGPDWGVRSYDGVTGLHCLAVGRLSAQRFGRVNAEGQVVQTAVDDSGSCADPSQAPSQLAVSRQAKTPQTPAAATLFGTVDPQQVKAVKVTEPDGTSSEIDGAEGAVLLVSEGDDAMAGKWRIVLVFQDGRTQSVTL